MGKDFNPNLTYPEDYPPGIAGQPVDRRGIDKAQTFAKRLKARRVKLAESNDAAASAEVAAGVAERLAERSVRSAHGEGEADGEAG